MGLETMNYISDFVVTNPTAADPKSQGDDHIRGMKGAIKATAPNLTGPMTATQAELNILDGATLSTAELNVLDGMTASTAELNILDGATLTTSELNYVDGVTSSIQTQLGAKADITGEAYTGTHDFSAAGSVLVPTPTLAGQAVNLAKLDATAFAAALPALGRAAGRIVATDGATDSWVDPSFSDSLFRVKGSADATKTGSFEVDTNVPTGTNVPIIWPGVTGTMARMEDIVLPSIVRSARTSNTILGLSDKTLFIDVTSGSFTQTLTAAATLGNGWYCYYKISSTGSITIDPNGAETIDGAATKVLTSGQAVLLQCDGTAFRTIMLDGGTFDSTLVVHTGNGYGSTNTKIRRFTTAMTSTGNAATYADSATLGATFTANHAGLYLVALQELSPGGTHVGVSVNSAQLTTDVNTITVSTRPMLVSNPGGSAALVAVSTLVRLAAGDVVRVHSEGAGTDADARVQFTMKWVGA